MRMNINESVWVKLTDHAKKHLSDKGATIVYREDKGGWYRFPLWEFMYIFGDAMVMGGPVFFEAGDIYFTRPV